jgi:hypothetical protein
MRQLFWNRVSTNKGVPQRAFTTARIRRPHHVNHQNESDAGQQYTRGRPIDHLVLLIQADNTADNSMSALNLLNTFYSLFIFSVKRVCVFLYSSPVAILPSYGSKGRGCKTARRIQTRQASKQAKGENRKDDISVAVACNLWPITSPFR